MKQALALIALIPIGVIGMIYYAVIQVRLALSEAREIMDTIPEDDDFRGIW